MTPGMHFLGWERPWADLVAGWLRADPDRLRRRLVVVPTHESGRRVRELLAEAALKNGSGAVLGPRLATPDEFFRPETPMPDVVRWAGWVQVMREWGESGVSGVFPGGMAQKSDSWRLGVARQIEAARELLAAGNLSFTQIAERLPADRERWQDLARLEAQVTARWRAWGLTDPVVAKREKALHPVRPRGVEELIIACVPDPTWLAVEAWQALGKAGLAVTVLVGAPAAYRDAFDEWGRPQPEFWTDRQKHTTPEPDLGQVAADPSGLAEGVVTACKDRSSRDMALGVCAASFAPAIARRLRRAGWETYDPQGNALPRDGWPELLEALATALETPEDHTALARVARHPVVWNEFLAETGARYAFQKFDRWERETCAISSARAIRALAEEDEDPELQAMGRLLTAVYRLVAGKAAALQAKLEAWLQADAAVAERARMEMGAWEVVRGKERGTGDAPYQAALPELLRWLGVSLSGLATVAPFEPAALPLQGWLELSFESAPHLVLAGLHEGNVPEAPAANPLITEVLREQFQLRDRRSRLARDIFLYTAMVEGRRAGGSVTVFTAQVDAQGEPCKPSRVLLQCPPEDLPGRVLKWIREKADLPAQPTPAWNRGAWQLQPPPDVRTHREWKHLSPSTLKLYLACPTRFYFQRVLRWEEFEPFEGELDGKGFGSLLHEVLAEWGEDAVAREWTDPLQLKTYWLEALSRRAAQLHGPNLPPLLQLQLLSARERLLALAEKQARERLEGWQIIAVEKEFNDVLKLAGVPLSMRVDRIDRHPDGRVRVIDYKTARGGIDPRKAHLRAWNGDCPEALGPLLEGPRGGQSGWSDLQLPLYARTVQLALQLEQVPSVCYVLLPDAVTETGFVEFEGMEAVLDSALQWAEEAARRIVSGVFWPPAPVVQYDAFETLAPDGLEAALSPAWVPLLAGPQKGAVLT